MDPEVNHGIDHLITRHGAAVVTEDSISIWCRSSPPGAEPVDLPQPPVCCRKIGGLRRPQLNLVQLVSFGCGVDAITTDETREILQRGGKLYTQLKIDEITNLGAVKSVCAACLPHWRGRTQKRQSKKP